MENEAQELKIEAGDLVRVKSGVYPDMERGSGLYLAAQDGAICDVIGRGYHGLLEINVPGYAADEFFIVEDDEIELADIDALTQAEQSVLMPGDWRMLEAFARSWARGSLEETPATTRLIRNGYLDVGKPETGGRWRWITGAGRAAWADKAAAAELSENQPKVDSPQWNEGDTVHHEIYGQGVVREVGNVIGVKFVRHSVNDWCFPKELRRESPADVRAERDAQAARIRELEVQLRERCDDYARLTGYLGTLAALEGTNNADEEALRQEILSQYA